MTRPSRSEPRTPYEVRLTTWLWIRRRIPRDFHQTIERYKATDTDFATAYARLEELESAMCAHLSAGERVEAMKREAQTLCRRVKMLVEQGEET